MKLPLLCEGNNDLDSPDWAPPGLLATAWGARLRGTMSGVLDEYSVDHHFAGKSPSARIVYDRLLMALRRIGPVREEPKKTSIHLVRSSALAGVEVRRDYLLLNLKTDYRIDSPRIAKAEQISARRFHQRVKLASPSDVDSELERWLADAYALSG